MNAEVSRMKLYELPAYQESRPKIYGLNPNGHENGVIEFDHIDGAYSYCVAYDGDGNRLSLCHPAAWTLLEPFKDGYRVVEDKKECA